MTSRTNPTDALTLRAGRRRRAGARFNLAGSGDGAAIVVMSLLMLLLPPAATAATRRLLPPLRSHAQVSGGGERRGLGVTVKPGPGRPEALG